jgi:hypothetical protein
MEGIIILIATIAVFLAIGIWMIVMAVKGPRIPKGHRFEAEHSGNKVILVVEDGVSLVKDPVSGAVSHFIADGQMVSGQTLAEQCAKSITATEKAFQTKNIQKADVKTVVVLFRTDASFEANSPMTPEWAKGQSAYATTSGATFGSGHPMAVVRDRYMKLSLLTGQPVIHEMVHMLNMTAGHGYQHNHSDKNLWIQHGAGTVEAYSLLNFADLNK